MKIWQTTGASGFLLRFVVAGLLGVLWGCGDAGRGAPSATATPGAATDLAPSQVAASTVPDPATPLLCDVDDLRLWTAQVLLAEETADAVIRIANAGETRCEVHVSESPLADPLMEPDVWLEPGGWADLVLGQSGRECFAPEALDQVEVVVNDVSVSVATAAVVTCGASLVAFYPNDPAEGPCAPDDLAVTSFDNGAWLLITNRSGSACRIGAAGGSAATAPAVPVLDLAPGDVAGWHYTDPIDTCASDVARIELEAVTVETETVPGCIRIAGPARPYFGDPDTTFASDGRNLDDPSSAILLLAPYSDLEQSGDVGEDG